MSKRLLFSLVFFLAISSQAQTVLENNPPSVKWRQVITPNFRVLYSKGFEEQAQRVANSLEQVREAGAKSLGAPPRRMTFILQNQSAISNGFVSILPRRSEFYGMPTQNYNFGGTNDWLDMLTVHEYRHVVQYQHATRGFNKAIYYLFGSISLAGMSQAAAPPWFWEGDAVATETALTPSGRGKIPNFSLLLKTNLLEGRKFNYHKLSLGSYRHNIPDEYSFGYHMVSHLRSKTNDPAIWSKVTARSWSVPFVPFAFSNAIKKETGLYVTGLYNDMADALTTRWRQEVETIELTPFVRVNRRRNAAYTDYLYPQALPDGNVLAMKKGIGDIQQFVLLKGGEEKVFTPGLMNETGMLSADGDVVVWNEYGFDPRWRVVNYSQVKAYNLSTRKRKRIGPKRARYASAAITRKGDKVVTIETDTRYRTNIVVLNVNDGSVIRKFPNESNDFYSMPRWSEDGSTIAIVKTVDDGKTITLIDAESGSSRDVLPVSQENVGYPVLHGEYLLFNSPVSGIDNIYAINLENSQRFQVTSSRLGAYNPSVSKDGKTIYYNDQSKDGMDVVSARFDPSSWKSYTVERPAAPIYQHLVEQEGHPDIFANVGDTTYPDAPYRKGSGIINPYNWGFAVENDLTRASVGLISRDILSTTTLNLGYHFDVQERTGALRGQVSYQAWYPIIDVTASYGSRSVNEGSGRFYDTLADPVTSELKDIVFKWKEANVQAGVRVPLLTTSSKYHGSVVVGNAVGVTQVSDFRNSIDGGGRFIFSTDTLYYLFFDRIGNGQLVYNHFSISAFRLLKQSHRDINSRWGQLVELQYFNTPFGGDMRGQQVSVFGQLYFPGLAKHHSLWGYGAYQHTRFDFSADAYTFRNQIPVPRGHSLPRFEDFYSVSANYTLPLWYPDIALGPLLNIQRLRANVFFDYGFGQGPWFFFDRSYDYASVGAEARFDLNIMRFFPQFDVGVRFSKGLRPAATEFEILIGTFRF